MKGIGMKKFTGYSAALAFIAAATLAGCPTAPATHTQLFVDGANNLAGFQLYFMPTPSLDFYQRVATPGVTGVNNPTDDATTATGAQTVVDLGVGNAISFYGKQYQTMWVGANGAIGFSGPADNSSLVAHFQMAGVSLVPRDAGDTAGRVSYEVTDGNDVSVTYEGVTAGGEAATAQAQFYVVDSADGGADPDYGDIVLSFPEISTHAAGVIGLSGGQLMGANQAQINAFMDNFNIQRGAALTESVMTGTVAASS